MVQGKGEGCDNSDTHVGLPMWKDMPKSLFTKHEYAVLHKLNQYCADERITERQKNSMGTYNSARVKTPAEPQFPLPPQPPPWLL